MKIYIFTDIEGISGIGEREQILPEYPNYRYSIERLMADVNAAVDGAFLGGAAAVTVSDAHGSGKNFDLTLLDRRAELDPKENRKWWGKLDGSYAGTYFIGAHAMAGTINGFLDHTQSGLGVYNYIVNGKKTGELGQWAICAGHFGVPLVMMSGDEAACAEARAFFGDIECAAVKRGLGRNCAKCYGLDASVEAIRDAAKRAAGLTGRCKPYRPALPMEIVEQLTRADYMDEMMEAYTGIERTDARTWRKLAVTHLDLFPEKAT